MHALDTFRFCPRCGSREFQVHDFKSKRCAACGFTWYLNAAAAVVGVVVNARQELLVVRRALEPARGTWDLPGGFVDMDETLEQALVRELREETGADVEPRRWLFSLPNRYEYGGFSVPTVDNFMLCRWCGSDALQPHDDVDRLFWVPLSRLDATRFGLGSIRRSIARLQWMGGEGLLGPDEEASE